MARMVVELTNRCNLSCLHCFAERHAGTGDLPLDVLDKVLSEGRSCEIEHISFTGGEPSIHREFEEVIRRVGVAGYGFSLVSNAVNFCEIYPLLLREGDLFQGVTFSLDGAREDTHDRIRGKGSFRRVMQAASVCIVRDIPFTFNMVLTALSHEEITEMVSLARQLGSGGVRFGHLMPTPATAKRGLHLSPAQRREAEREIWKLKQEVRFPIGMAPGHYSEDPFFPCGPLEIEEFNLDYRGNLSLCCQLSGYEGSANQTDLVANLRETSLTEACRRFRSLVARYLADKRERVQSGAFGDLDHFPCWYCVKYLGKAEWAANLSQGWV